MRAEDQGSRSLVYTLAPFEAKERFSATCIAWELVDEVRVLDAVSRSIFEAEEGLESSI